MSPKQPRKPSDSPRNALPPPLAVKRMSLYLRRAEALADKGQQTVSSQQLGKALGLTDAQVRKDLTHFGQFGRPGVGYPVGELTERLRAIFGTDRVWNVAVVGVGSLGRALLRYKGFAGKGFRPKAAFDSEDEKIGKKFGQVVVQPMSELADTVRKTRIRLAILAVPAEVAQDVTDRLCRVGIRGILNFAPVTLTVPAGVAVVPVDLAVQLEQLSYLVNVTGRKKQTSGV
ncbi:MAG: redox-sensing transcriptional repressor Rex [Planctomycetota bacterium]|nr:redox-sensing transcriptional repressor Rex [Planctomycetota bacterium]